jgi:hypothetical protein
MMLVILVRPFLEGSSGLVSWLTELFENGKQVVDKIKSSAVELLFHNLGSLSANHLEFAHGFVESLPVKRFQFGETIPNRAEGILDD